MRKVKVDERQFVGFALLGGLVCIVVISRMSAAAVLHDLQDGTLGLLLPLAVGMSVPRRWLAVTFGVIGLWLAYLGGFWLFLDMRGQSKSPLYWIAFLVASLIMFLCSRLAAIKAQHLDA